MKRNPSIPAIIFTLPALIGLAAALGPQPLRAEAQYQGAAVVLQKLASQAALPPEDDKNSTNEVVKLRRDIQAFQTNSAALSPEDAAQGWVALLDRLNRLPRDANQESGPGDEQPGVEMIMKALPPPAAWDALVRTVEARPAVKGIMQARELSLRLLAHTLAGNPAAQKTDVAALEKLLADASPNEAGFLQSEMDGLEEIMLQNSDDPDAVMKSLETRLARLQGQEYPQSLAIPDLISLVGTNKTEEFLRRALRAANVRVEIEKGNDTLILARKLALEMAPELKTPQWRLACSLDAAPLYEALQKRFAPPVAAGADTNAAPVVPRRQFGWQNSDSAKSEAQAYYLLGLIIHQRTQEAVALAQQIGGDNQNNLPADALVSLERHGYANALNDFFHDLLAKKPGLPFWDEYVRVAASAGKTEDMLAFARTTAARDDLSPRERTTVSDCLYHALLAADKIDEGVAEIHRVLAAKDDPNAGEPQTASHARRAELGLALAQIGQLMERQDWLDEGASAVRVSLSEKSGGRADYESRSLPGSLAEVLMDAGRGPEAEEVLLESLLQKQPEPQAGMDYMPWSNNNSGQENLVLLAKLYSRAGRQADVLVLLDQAPGWGFKDLADFYQRSWYHAHGQDSDADAVSFAAAAALAANDRKPEARKILDAILDQNGGFDPAYELLLKLDGTNVSARLDALFARDQFEERPLIWKAHLLREAGKLEEAEAAARQAISVDPSDGEQGPGRRMRAYAELADIREARGDQKQADFYRGAVQAIRLSEKADRFYEAGLLSRAVKMYEESLDHFADAYCIQSRLALRLSELGMHEAAEAHYLRAYELMPDSFGRVESHCFGCEGVFNGEQAQSLAESVFTKLVVKTPDKPQVHYLLGYLREEEGRYREALPEFRQAVKLDPDYLNAWKHLKDTGEQLHLPAADQNAVVFNLWRLDPLGLHVAENNADTTDLRGLWAVVENAARMKPATPADLYPLAASRVQMEKEARENKAKPRRNRYNYGYRSHSSEEQLTPAAVVARQPLINAAAQLLQNSSNFQDF